MTNPFRTKIYTNNPQHGALTQSDMAQTRGDQRAGGPLVNSDSKLRDDEFSSPEENKTMQ